MELRAEISIKEGLTRGKFYRIIEEDDHKYFVINNIKVKQGYPKNFFEKPGVEFEYNPNPNLGRLVEKCDTARWLETAWGGLSKTIQEESLSSEFKAIMHSIDEATRPGVVEDATNNGGSTDYYKFNPEWKEVADIIEAKDMSYNIANCFKACFRLGGEHHSSKERDLNKIIYFAQRELDLLKKKKQNG